jgi:hypothetical protein
VSARTQKSRFKDLEWSSVAVMSSLVAESPYRSANRLSKKREKEKEN